MSAAVKPNRRRRSFAPLKTEIRAERLRQDLTLIAVSEASGISSYRVSIIERALDEPTAEELAKLREAIARLAKERSLS
jgi:transcriptional regulator with XRE-family HTH domain